MASEDGGMTRIASDGGGGTWVRRRPADETPDRSAPEDLVEAPVLTNDQLRTITTLTCPKCGHGWIWHQQPCDDDCDCDVYWLAILAPTVAGLIDAAVAEATRTCPHGLRMDPEWRVAGDFAPCRCCGDAVSTLVPGNGLCPPCSAPGGAA